MHPSAEPGTAATAEPPCTRGVAPQAQWEKWKKGPRRPVVSADNGAVRPRYWHPESLALSRGKQVGALAALTGPSVAPQRGQLLSVPRPRGLGFKPRTLTTYLLLGSAHLCRPPLPLLHRAGCCPSPFRSPPSRGQPRAAAISVTRLGRQRAARAGALGPWRLPSAPRCGRRPTRLRWCKSGKQPPSRCCSSTPQRACR